MAEPTADTTVYAGREAKDKIHEGFRDALAADRASRMATAGVEKIEYINYAQALVNYQSRSDIEDLAARRARDAASTFSATDFTRVKETPTDY